MSTLNIKNISKVLVIGAIYDQIDKINKVKELSKNYDLVVFNGNLTYPFDHKLVQERINFMDSILSKNILYNVGNLDYEASTSSLMVHNWIKNKPNIIKLNFDRVNILITSGGLASYMPLSAIDNEDLIESSFISKINNKNWHLVYGGAAGYVISNNPLSSTEPEFFNYSCRIGTIYNGTSTCIYGQEIQDAELKKTMLI